MLLTSPFLPFSPVPATPKTTKFGGARTIFQSETVVNTVIAQMALPITNFIYQAYRDRLYIQRTKAQIFRVLKQNDLRECSFDDIVGHEPIKKKLQGWAQRINAKQQNTPYGILLAGEPGTGKSLLTRAFAKSVLGKATLLKVNCEALAENPATIVFLENKIQKLQKKNKPLILLMDEMGTIGSRTQTGSAGEYSMIVRLLKIMDGLSTRVSMVATTNNHERLDPAIRNRFPEILEVHSPTRAESIQQLKKYLEASHLKADDSVDWQEAALQMEDLTGRRIEYVAQGLRNARLNEQMGSTNPVPLTQKPKRKFFKEKIPPVQTLSFSQGQLLDAIQGTQNSV